MKLYSYNVNGIRAALGKGLAEWISTTKPDVLCIQETKARTEQFDQLVFEALGYHHYWMPAEKKGYSGVGVLCKNEPDQIIYGMGISKYDYEGRMIRVDFGETSIISVYFPSGTSGGIRQDFKMEFLYDFSDFIKRLLLERPRLIISGDYNICHKAIDINNPKRHVKSSGFLPEEREWFDGFVDIGFIDSFRAFNSSPDMYSWWSYRANSRAKNLGWRIDYHMVSKQLGGTMVNAGIDSDIVHSDHCPVWVELNI
jgi:exodeoxyribonuclease-3